MLLTQIVSAMTVTLCMLIDSIMIGRFLGVNAMTAYGLSTPVLLVFAALGSMISACVQVMCGKTMGCGDKKGTEACFTVSVVFAIVISVVGVSLVLLFTDQICVLLGAAKPNLDKEVFDLTRDYLRGFIIGAPAFMSAQMMVPYMQMSGSRTRLVVAVGAMIVADVFGDLMNVFVVKWSTLGMGLASSLSYYVAFIIGVIYFFKKDCIFKFRISLVKMSVCIRLVRDGVPTLVNQVSLVLLTYVLNKMLLSVGGKLAVAAYSVISTAGNICYSFSSGIAAVALTLSAILYTDGDRNALKQLVKTMNFYSVVICGIVTAVIIAAAKPIVWLFLTNKSALGIAVTGMRLFVLSLVPCSMNTCFKNFYQGTDKTPFTMTISVMQNFLLTCLSAYILSRFMGLNGIWLGFLCGESLTLIIISMVVFVKNKKAAFTPENFSLLEKDFGVNENDCIELSITDPSQVVVVSQKASDFCNEHGLTTRLSSLIALCIEEMTTNIVEHGFRGRKEHTVEVRVIVQGESALLRIRDNCENFDPVKYLDMHKDDDPIAHIGIRMVMKLVKEANYVNSLGLNNLTLTI